MECSVLTVENGTFKVVDLLPYKSIVWVTEYLEHGGLQAVFARSDYVLNAVKAGRYAVLDDDTTIMYIHTVKITPSEVWAYGYEAKYLFDRCAVAGRTFATFGDTEIGQAISDQITSYCEYSWLGTITVPELGNGNLDSLDYVSLWDFVACSCEIKNAGFKVVYNSTTKKGDVVVYQGQNHSTTAIFSVGLGNFNGATVTDSDADYINTVYVIGENNVVVVAQRTGFTGEIYSDVLDLRDEYPKPDEMTDAEYEAALEERGNMMLTERIKTRKIELQELDSYNYGITYSMGDIVTIYDPIAGGTVQRRVVAVQRVIEGNVDKIKITLDEV